MVRKQVLIDNILHTPIKLEATKDGVSAQKWVSDLVRAELIKRGYKLETDQQPGRF